MKIKMKKVIALLFVLIVAFSFVGCSANCRITIHLGQRGGEKGRRICTDRLW